MPKKLVPRTTISHRKVVQSVRVIYLKKATGKIYGSDRLKVRHSEVISRTFMNCCASMQTISHIVVLINDFQHAKDDL